MSGLVTMERSSAMVIDTKLRACIVERGASHENRIVEIDIVVAAFQRFEAKVLYFLSKFYSFSISRT